MVLTFAVVLETFLVIFTSLSAEDFITTILEEEEGGGGAFEKVTTLSGGDGFVLLRLVPPFFGLVSATSTDLVLPDWEED